MAPVSAVQMEIEERLRSHAEALSRRDTDAALELFASDAVLKIANAEPVRGAHALREFFERTFAAMTLGGGRFFTEELYLYDVLAFHFGSYEFESVSGQIQEKGGFAIVWRRQRDGSWRYHRGILNSTLPPAHSASGRGN
jgi:ketosteroid isomerase-like protein